MAKTVLKEEIIEEKDFLVELTGLIDSKLLSANLSQSNFLEIETEKPVLQIGNLLFQGAFEPLLGSAVCFQPQNDPNKPTTSKGSTTAQSADNLTSLEYLSKSDLKLKMKRVYLDKKKTNDEIK